MADQRKTVSHFPLPPERTTSGVALDWKPCTSSWATHIAWIPQLGWLAVRFRDGHNHVYFSISATEWDELCQPGTSIGHFIHSRLEPRGHGDLAESAAAQGIRIIQSI